MMRRVFRLERVGIPSLPQAILGRQKATKLMAPHPGRRSRGSPSMAVPWANTALWMA